MLNLFGNITTTVDASEAVANTAISTAEFMAITSVKHPAVREFYALSLDQYHFLSWDDYVARRDHAEALWEAHYLAEEARKRKLGLARAKARREAEIKQAFALEGRVRLIIKTKQAA